MSLRTCFFARLGLPAASALVLAGLALAQDVPVICYHDISDVRHNSMTTTSANFAAQMRYLKAEGYTTLSLDELVAFMEGRARVPEKSIVLTFDDGYEGVFQYAYPELERLGFKATVFLVVGSVGDQTRKIPHLTWDQVREMDSKGVVSAEAHCGVYHTFLARCWSTPKAGQPTREEIVADLDWAKRALAKMLGHSVQYLAWPQGSYNPDLIRVAGKLGYRALVTADYGLNHTGGSVRHIKRLRMSSASDTLAVFRSKLALAHFLWAKRPTPVLGHAAPRP